jgi:endonuclease-3
MAYQYMRMMARKTNPKPTTPKKTPVKPSRKKVGGRKKAAARKAATKKSARKLGARAMRWSPADIEEAFRRFHEANPEPRGELNHVNPFTLLVAVVLSAQATDAGVNKATRALFAIADTPQNMLALGEERLRDHIKTIGLYRNKAKNVIALSEKLIAEFGSVVPRTRAELESLPGAGRKTANVVLNMAFGEHTMAVDTHVFRVSKRIGLATANANTPFAVEKELVKNFPKELIHKAHHWLILHGRYICVARNPKCEECGVRSACRYFSINKAVLLKDGGQNHLSKKPAY